MAAVPQEYVTRREFDRRSAQIDNDVTEIWSRLDAIAGTQAEHTRILGEHTRVLGEHTRVLGEHTRILGEHGRALGSLQLAVGELRTDVAGLKTAMTEVLEILRAG